MKIANVNLQSVPSSQVPRPSELGNLTMYRHTLETYHPQKHYKSSDSHPDCLWSIAPSMIISNHFTKGHFHRHRHLPNNITVLPSLCCRNISRPPGLLQVVHLSLRRNIYKSEMEKTIKIAQIQKRPKIISTKKFATKQCK